MAELSNEERLRRFYNFLGSESVGMKNLPDFTTFSRKMQDADRREQLYEGLKTQKHIKNLPDNFDSFNKLIGMSIPINPIPQNDNGHEVMDINGVSRMDYSSPSLAQPKQEEVQQAAVVSQPQNVAEAAQQPVDTTSAAVTTPTSTPTVQEPVQQHTTPVTEQSTNTPKVTTPSVPSDFTPYDQRMAEQTKPIQDLMQESRDADLTAQANAAEWSSRENDLNNNFKQFNDAQEKLNGEYVDFQAKVKEFNSKYPKDWQPKNNSEYSQYQKDREVVESLQNLLNAKQDVLNEELGKLGKEADIVGKHYNDVANSSTYIAQKLEGNVSGLLNSVKQEIANSTTYMSGKVRTDGKQAVTVGYAGAPKVKQEQNKVEEFGYRVAERILQRTQNQIDEYHAEKEDEATTAKWGKNVPWLGTVAGNVADYMKGYFRGEIDAIKDGAGFDFGIKDAVEMKYLYDAVQKSDRIDEIAKKKANGEKLSNEEKALFDSGLSNSERAILDAAAMEVVAASMYKTGFGYTGGQVGVDMIPFMLEIAINPLALVGKSVGSAVTRYAFKKFGAKAAKHGMLRGAAFTARTLAGTTVGGTGMAVTTGAGKTFADYNRRKTGQIKYGLDDYGNLVFGGHEEGMSSGKAAVTAIASQSLEYSTENFSEIMRGVGRVTGANKFLGKNITKLMHGVANLDSNEVGKLIKTYKRAGHIGNVFEEYNEEVVNNIGNGIIDAIAEGKNNFTTAEGGVFNLEDNVETFLSVTMPQVFQEIIGLGASGIHSAIQRHRYNQQMQQTIQNNINLFGADRWSAIRSVLDGAKGIEELSRNAVALVDDEEYSPEQKEAIIQYAHDLQAKRAEDLAETKLSDYQYDTDKDYQELSNRTKTDGTITPATTKEGDVVYVKSDEDGSDTAVVYNPETGETTQIPSGDIAETGETLDANDEADKIEQAREIAQTIESGTSATINDNIFTVVDKNPDNGMPIAEVTDANGNLIETREMTNEEVIAMSQQMEAAAQEEEDNKSLDPLQKLQKALESNDPKLMEQGVQELSETIAEIEDEPTLDSLEAKVSALGEDVVKKVKPLFDRKRAEISGKEEGTASTEYDPTIGPKKGNVVWIKDYYNRWQEVVIDSVDEDGNAWYKEPVSGIKTGIDKYYLNQWQQEHKEEVENNAEGQGETPTVGEGGTQTPTGSTPQAPTGAAPTGGTPMGGGQVGETPATITWENAKTDKNYEDAKEETANMYQQILDTKGKEQALIEAEEHLNNLLSMSVNDCRDEYGLDGDVTDEEIASKQRGDIEALQEFINRVKNDGEKEDLVFKVGKAIKDKWKTAKREVGNKASMTFSGRKLKGHYVLAEADAPTPSHNPLDGFKKSVGFPEDENGKTINDRDYENDKNEQNGVIAISTNYTGEALTNMPVLSRDSGIPYSGNKRTQAGILAAQNGTDTEYIESLKDNLENYGFDEEDLAKFTHPRVFFVLDEELPYDTETFALFNKTAEYAQGRSAMMVKLGKILDGAIFNQMMDAIGSHETISEVWSDKNTVNTLISTLQNGGILSQAEYARFVDNNELTEEGKELIVNALIGKVLEGKEEAVKAINDPDTKQLATSVITALPQIAANKQLGDASLMDYISDAIILAHDARKNGVSGNMPITTHLRQQDIAFEEEEKKTPSAIAIAIGTFIHSNKTSYLRDFLKKYNDYSRDNSENDLSLFEDIPVEERVNQWLVNGIDGLIQDLKSGKKQGNETKQFISTLEQVKQLLLNTNNNGQGTGQAAESGEHPTGTGGSQEVTGNEPEGGKEVGNSGTGNGEHGVRGSNEGGQVGSKPTGEKPATPTKPSKPSKTPTTHAEAVAHFNAMYGEGTPKAKSAIRVWELTHKGNKPSVKPDGKSIGLDKSENTANAVELTDEEAAELEQLGIQLGKDFVESGDIKFADFFKTMVINFGDGIRPFTKSIYNGISSKVSEEIEDQMDDRKTIRAFDINTPITEEGGEVEQTNEEGNESSNLQESEGDNAPGNLVGGESEGEDNDNGDSGTGLGTNTGTGNGEVVSGNDNGTEKPTAGSGSGESVGQREKGTSNGSGSVRSGRVGNRGNRGNSSNGGVRTTGGNRGSNVPVKESGNTRELTDEEKAKQAEEKAYNEAVEAYSKETNIDVLKSLREGFKKDIQAEEDFLKKAELQGKYRAATERIKDLLKEQPKANVDITQEKVPYVPVSDPEGTHAIGSVVPSGALAYLNDAITKLEEKVGKGVDEFVREELGYDSLEDMYSDYANNKTNGLASEQVDSVGLAIQAMKEKRCFIIGDMTGVGKGRQAASIIRWGVRNKKKVIFVTEKPDLFTSMYEDLKDIGTTNLTPYIVNNDADANITETVEGQYVEVEVEDADGNITKEQRPKKRVIVRHASSKIQNELYNSDTDELPAINGKGEKKYDFVMMTYSQTGSKTASAQKKLEWLKNYAKDAIIILDEAHNASGESNTGQFFQDVVQNCEGVTFLSATYAKRPENMALYALRSSMSQINMTKEDLINAISEYGIPMQEILAGALFQSGEMVRRERDFSDVKTHWLVPTDMYNEKEIENLQKTSDMTSNLLSDMIAFQRDNLNPIIDTLNADFEKQNAENRLKHGPIKIAKYTPYSGQVSNVFGMMMYGMKSRKTAEMAIQQIKEGKKPVIAVENTLGAYIDALPEGEIDSADFSQVFDRGLDGLTKYSINMYTWDDNAKGGRGGYVLTFKQELDAAKEDGVSTAIIQAKINEYKNNESRVPLSLSPIDQIKQMIADAGYKCGEITGRNNALQFNKNGTVTKVPRRTDKKNEMTLFNNGGSDAIILNVAGATGISLHSSKRFKDQKQRTMLILQPAKNVNTEVQMRGRIDRTGQVHRGEYFYVTSPVPAEQKLIMMLKQKLASLDANSVGTEDVSSNKVDTQDMDNKYGDEVAKQFLIENWANINLKLDHGVKYDSKRREYQGHEGLLYDIFIGIQRMDCATQEYVINELTQRYAEQIEYLNQSGINDLKTATMKLDASTIDEAVMIKGKDDESSNYFAHDTKIERVEANVLKKPLRSADIIKKMKKLGVYGEGDTINDDYGTTVIYEQVVAAADKIIEDFKAKQEEALKKFKEGLPNKLKWNVTMLTPEQIEEKIKTSTSYVQFTEKQAAELAKKQSEIFDMRSTVYNALNNLKPGMPYFVPLTDNVGNDAPMMYGRFIGFETGDYKPRNIKAVFAVKDSRSQITIPVISHKEAIKKIIDDSRYEMIFQDLMRGENRNSWDYKEPSSDEKLARVDEWWDKMIPKGETNRQIRYMITGNVLQACGALGKHKGQIVSFTRLDKETGEVVIDKGMLLAEDFDPENFRIKKKITKEDVWSNYMEHKDDDHFISVHRSGDQMVVKFLKQPNKKLSEHPAKTDEELMKLTEYFDARRDELRAYVDEKNVEAVLDLLYDKYSFTADELFVMPDSTEKPDAIVPTNKPYREVIDSLSDKYSCYGEYDCRNKLKKMLKQYKMDVNNEDLKNQIKEVSQLYQAYLREKYTKEESVHLAWEAIIYDERAKQALANDDKDDREKCMRIREAIIEELNYRGFSGHEMHFKQGDWDKKEFVDTFNKLNSNPDNAKRFEKIWDIISKLDMNIILSEKITNDTGGQAAGKVVEYNWKYMNAKYISDQAKADTILHEITHTVTAYAIWAVKHGYDHLLSADMLQDVSDLKSILGIIKNKEAFKHDSADGKYTDYGVTNEQELLAEISSNESFRNDLKKVNLIVGSRYGKVAFYEDTPQNAGMAGTSKVNAYDAVMEVLDRMIAGYNQKAWEEVYKGSQYGGYAYSRFADQMRKEGKGEQAIKDATNPQAITLLPGEPFSHYVRRVAEAFKGNEKLRVAHLDTAIEYLKAINDPEAEIKGSVMKYLFEQLNGKANLPLWFETQESARKQDDTPFRLDNDTIYGWTGKDGFHWTIEGFDPNRVIHEYGHAWMAAMKEINPALYESLLRLANGTAAWKDVVNDPNYSNLKTDDEILSEVFCRFSGSQGEQKLIDVTREAISNGVDMKDKAAIAGEYSRLAKKLDRVWEKVMKDVLNQDMNQFDSMSEAADMMLRDILNGNNPNDGGYTPSGKLKKSPYGGNPFFVDKNQYSRGGVATHPMSVANDIYERSVSTLGSEWREAWFDYLRSVRKLQEAVVAQTGNEVRDFENAYLHLQHLSSVNKAEQDKVQSTIVEPLIKAMNAIVQPLIKDYKKKGGNYKSSSEQAMDDLEKYMIAKHGLERNKVLARRDAKNKAEKEYAAVLRAAEEALRKAKEALTKGTGTQADVDAAEQHLNDVKAQMLIRENNLYAAYRKKDYSGFTETFGEGLTDPTNADLEKEAKDYLNNFESTIDKALIDELWKRINEVNGYTLDKALKSGNISKDLYTTLKNQYQNYVPLRGWDKETAEDVYRYMNEGRDKFQPTQKTAFGRKSRAGEILATMLSMNSAAIIQGNKNLAKQKLLNLIQNNPTKLLSVSKTWYEMDSSGNFNPVYPVDASGNPLTDPDDIDAWEKDMEEKRKQNTATIVHGHLKLGLPIKPWQEEEHQIRVNRNGKEYVIYVNGSPNAAKAISGGLNADAKKTQDIEYFTRPVGQFMARAFTAFNPLFLIRNLEKDAISAAMVNGIKYGSGYSWKFAKNFDKLMPLAAFTARATYKQKDKVDVATRGAFGIYKLIHRYNNGTLDTTNEVEKYFQEFMDNGGHTGYSQLWNVEKYDDVINKAIKKANSKVVAQRAQGVVETIATIVEFMNAGFEDISRFATYMTSRQMGRSILMSVADAKDASTNFNKKGSGAKGNRTARDLYIFMNPAIQGVTRYIYRLCNNDISGKGKDADIKGNQTTRAMAGFASLAAYGALMTAICYYCGVFFTGGDDGDDEEFGKEGLGNDYWKLSTFKRRNTINFPGQFLGEGYITINLTPEEAVPYSIGAIIAEHTLGYGHTDQILPEISSQLSRLVPQLEVSPQKWQTVGDLGAEIWRDIIPSAALPIWEVYDNRDFMGNKIHGYENSLKKGTPRLQTVVHNWIDQTTNGRLGAFGNINNIEHIMNGYFGGIVEFPMLVVNSFEGAFLEEGVNLNETPAKVFWNSTANKWNETSALRNEFDYYKSIVDYFDSRLKAQGHTKQKDQESFVNQLKDDDIDIQYWKAFQRIAPEYNSRKVTDKDAVMRKAVQAWHKIDEESKKKK